MDDQQELLVVFLSLNFLSDDLEFAVVLSSGPM
jgi:hypothetical protein